jgi:5-dehydro-2-deoxygluconokinase
MDIRRFSGGRFLVMGRAGMDLLADPPGTPADAADRFVAHLGGSSANIAVALSRQGHRTALLSAVSDDAVGRFCIAQLDHYGVDAEHVRVVHGEARSSLAVADSRLEDYQCVIYRNGAADLQLETADVDRIDFERYDAFVVTGTALAAEPSRAATFRAFERASAARIPIVLDLDYRPYSWATPRIAAQTYLEAAERCDLLVGNDVEFAVMAGGPALGYALARRLATDSDRIVVYKMGEQGSVTLHRGAEERAGIYPVAALKPAGAGDAFLGTLLAGLADGRPIAECVARGSAAAAMVVSRVGCAPAMPTTTELGAFLATRSMAAPLELAGAPE